MHTETSQSRFLELISAFAGKRVLAIGDLMLDEFIWGRVSRISPEAPVPVVNVTGESYYPGGAANVARNLREFTRETSVAGITGADAPGRQLVELLAEAGIRTDGVVEDAGVLTTVKTRVIARNQQVVRVDRERKVALTAEQQSRVCRYLERAIAETDGIVVADYGKGFLSQPLADEICRLARRHSKVLAVDPHPHTALVWNGATVIKPNRAELFLAAGLPPAEPVEPVCQDAALIGAAKRLVDSWQPQSLLITLAEQGMLLVERDTEPVHLAARAREVFDVSGAGDTAIAVLTLGLVAGGTAAEAAELANRASGIVVGKIGTATLTAAELIASLERG
ncbi:MAG TPA: PfkB family carbohydrate kinase [Bryobacteraceae bacterium]|jgi:D-beta-D-heptose 7-phosphate kinase/D-beta-D-heptose 1-phosphate adenosyltransferase|nr:PfkB family carbohydrate kinase [Bryobacteraceae bacterium]